MSRILAIDPGSTKGLGWAVLEARCGGVPVGARLVDSGVIKTEQMGPDDRSELWHKLGSMVSRWLSAPGMVDAVAYERIHRHSGVHAAHMYGGQVAVIQRECYNLGVPWITVQVAVVKRFLNCRASGGAKNKAMVDAAHALGYTSVADHNEADAVGIGLAGLEQWETGKNVFGN